MTDASAPTRAQELPRPLEGFRVLELAQMVAGPSAALLLADYGAEVLKVEPPSGDTFRNLRSAAAATLSESPVFVGYNRGKRVTRIDIRTDEGRAEILRLTREADVVIESSRPGTMDRLGLGADVLLAHNPRLIYASVSGFGQGETGFKMGGVDIIVQAESGIMSTTGFKGQPPTKVGFTVVDAACGHALCHGILAALLRRERTGHGEIVRVSLYDVALHLQTGPLMEYLATGIQEERSGNSAPLTAPADSFRCADGHVVISAYTDAHWKKFISIIGAPELAADPRFLTPSLKVVNRAAMTAIIEEKLATHGRAHWVEVMRAQGLLAGQVKDYKAVVSDPLTRESGMIRSVGAGYGVANPVKLVNSPDAPMSPREDLQVSPRDVGFHSALTQRAKA
jgi:crotonobetainyl-CoA:carnitine CoA-transferase CaiB-like acyl-CoA transferase